MSIAIAAIVAGHAIEHGPADNRRSGDILLVSGDTLIVDPCDGSTPIAATLDELHNPAIYTGG